MKRSAIHTIIAHCELRIANSLKVKMKNRITIIDYGMGNLYSVVNAFKSLGAETIVTSDPKEIAQAEKILLPGVGAFGDCMNNLEKSGLIPVIKEALNSGKPFLVICLGMQVLFEGSE